MSGKRGRPPEDRLLRQREIFMAVAPMIESGSARSLTMRKAARAAHVSLGGIYHYFPTKRSLMLHSLSPGAFARLCADFHRQYGPLKDRDPGGFLEAYIDWQVQECAFVRPALWAAMELGVPIMRAAIANGIESGLRDFIEPLRAVAPELSDSDAESLGRSLRRLLFAALLDRNISSNQLRLELRALISGYRAIAAGGLSAVGLDLATSDYELPASGFTPRH
jgi:AcrR family transcriptional regulator